MNLRQISRYPVHCFAYGLAAVVLVCNLAHAADGKAEKFLTDAQIRFDKKDYSGAIIQSKNALQVDRSFLPAHTLLGRALLKMGDPVGAEVTLSAALALGIERAQVAGPLAQALLAQGKLKQLFEHPNFELLGLPRMVQVQVQLARASAHADMGDLPLALKSVLAAQALDSSSLDSAIAEVPIRIGLRQLDQGTQAAERALRFAPDSSEAWYSKAVVLHVAGNTAAALSAYDKAIGFDPDYVVARLARASMLVDMGLIERATVDLTEVRRLTPDDPKAAYLRALIARKENKPEAVRVALKEVTEMLDRLPMDYIRFRPHVLMLNGLAHNGLNEPEKAKVYFEAFQKVQPDAPTAKLLAQIYLQKSDFDRAVDVLEKYLKAQPSDGQALALLGSALMGKGQLTRAATLMQQALQSRESTDMRTVLGLSLMQSGQTASAIKELESALKSSPGKSHVAMSLVLLHFRSGQPAKALVLAEKLATEHPDNPGLLSMLGLVKINSGDAIGAKAAFERAIRLDADFIAPKLNLARIEIVTRSYEVASRRLAEILALEPKHADAMLELAVISERKDLLVDALGWLQKAHALSGPREIRFGLALSDFYLRTDRPGPALEVAKEISGKAPDDLSVLIAYAKAQLAKQDLAGAKSTLVAATIAANYDPPAQVQIAVLQIAADNIGGAIYSVDKALSKEPDYLPAMAMMAELELRQGDYAKAEKRAKDIIAKHGKRGLGHKLLGDITAAKGQPAVALIAYRKSQQLEPRPETVAKLLALAPKQENSPALEGFARQWLKENPNDALVARMLAEHYLQTSNFAQARLAYEALVQLEPHNSNALNQLAIVLLQMKDPGAAAVAERAVAKDPNNGSALATLGWAVLQNGQAFRARGLLLDAKLREPRNPEIRYHLAVALAQTGDKDDARRELEAALRSTRPFASKAQAVALLKSLS